MKNTTMTMAVLPARAAPRPRKRARRQALRRRYRLQILAAAAAVLIAALARTVPALGVPPEGGRPVEWIAQNPELPNGCEVTSLAIALGAAGCPADKLELYRDYLPKADFSQMDGVRYGPDPEKWYAGDAADPAGGWYCFEGPIVQAANGWLDHCGSSLRARDLTGLSRVELDRYAQAGTPLVVWVTLGYAAPQYSGSSWTLEDGRAYRPYRNLHCVVLAGVADGQYRICDPISGFAQMDKSLFWDSFSAMGGRAVAIG